MAQPPLVLINSSRLTPKQRRVRLLTGQAIGKSWAVPMTPAFFFSLFFWVSPTFADFEGQEGMRREPEIP